MHRYQNKCLGVCSLKFGSQVYPQVTFYEITESEISEMTCLAEEDELSSNSPPLSDATLPKGLPPKKRKRRRMIRYDIIFTVDKGFIRLSPDHVFFTLSRDAVTESLTDANPHKVQTLIISLSFFFFNVSFLLPAAYFILHSSILQWYDMWLSCTHDGRLWL